MKPFEKAGDKYKDFQIEQSDHVEELGCLLREVVHVPSGAHIVHIKNEDPENVFCLALRTLPDSSNGVAHILEHTVLCGSKKFPVRDPFFSMNRRSLNTYMNALTGSDFTCYPAASQVPKDFYNLLDVYLDAVFYPNLKELSFLQEGHRLEFSNPSDSNTPLMFKGIVFNEMKGSFSSPMSRLWDQLMENLFPDILYSHNSGGRPLDIPSLTYSELLEFHKKFYQESRCVFYFYGNLPLEGHLDFLEEKVLKQAKKLPALAPNPTQTRFEKPKTIAFPYPLAAHEKKENRTYNSLTWLTCSLKDQIDLLALQTIDLILMGTDASPLKQAILNSDLCQNVYSLLEDELSEVPYCIVFEGTEKEKLSAIKNLVYDEIAKLIQNPIDPELVEAAIHQLELSRTEINSDYGPFGLSLILKIIPLKNIGAPYANNLKIHCQFEALRERIKKPHYLTSLIEKYFLSNPHFISSAMYPDSNLIQKELDKESEMLSQIQKQLTSDQAKQIIENTANLKAFQEACENQDLEVLPKVTLKDVSPSPRDLKLSKKQQNLSTLYHHDCPTNGIIYQDISFKLPKIEFEDLPYVKLFAYLLPQLGANQRDYISNLKMIQLHTGGVHAFLDSLIPVDKPDAFEPHLIFQGKSLKHNFGHLTTILFDIIDSPELGDKKRMKELVSQLYVELDHDLKQNCLKYAVNLSVSGFYTHSFVQYYWSGIGYYEAIKKMALNLDAEIPNLIEKLKSLKDSLLHAQPYDLITTCSEKLYSEVSPYLEKLTQFKPKPYTPWDPNFELKEVSSQGKMSSTSVFFTSAALKTTHFLDPDAAFLSVAAKLLDNTHLHRAIREQGGAYGGGASNKVASGKFCFYAYRDPNLANTLEAYKMACKKVEGGHFSSRELEEAKLGVIQKLDQPISPEYRGLTAYSWLLENKSYENREKLRKSIINATKEDVQKALKKYVSSQIDKATVVSFGPKEALERENKMLESKKMKPLLIQSI